MTKEAGHEVIVGGRVAEVVETVPCAAEVRVTGAEYVALRVAPVAASTRATAFGVGLDLDTAPSGVATGALVAGRARCRCVEGVVRGVIGPVRVLIGAATRTGVGFAVVVADDGPVALEHRTDLVHAPLGPRQGQVVLRVTRGVPRGPQGGSGQGAAAG